MKLFAGCDVGSTTGKAVVLNEAGDIMAHYILPSAIDPEVTAIESLSRALAGMASDYKIADMARVVGASRGFAADGIVVQTMKFCDTWGVDAQIFVDKLREDGFEALRLEREYTRGGIGQLRTRVQAFLEMLGK